MPRLKLTWREENTFIVALPNLDGYDPGEKKRREVEAMRQALDYLMNRNLIGCDISSIKFEMEED